KTQVFPLETHDAIRTRLTHSLEVSTLAGGLASLVAKWLVDQGEIKVDSERRIEAIAKTCGLIHDLGNPPFGHAGEKAIRGWFDERFLIQELKDTSENKDPLSDLLGHNPQLVQDF